jgi:sec-independent protein translocase protein TatB
LFDLNFSKILVLAVLGLLIFGPEQLPKMAAQAGQVLRDLRRLAERARTELSDSLGPEFSDFDLTDLNPKAFVRKHLLDDMGDGLGWPGSAEVPADAAALDTYSELSLVSGEIPPYDTEAT